MVPTRTIVGIGEALLSSGAEGEAAGGLAAEIALSAVRLKQRGVAVSRVGQDAAGSTLLAMLAEAGVDTQHIQRDPDLPTGRRRSQPLGGAVRSRTDERAAFDNLQWDFDLEDLAQRTDAAVFGLVAGRSGQSGSEIKRFLAAARGALRILDMTNREPDAAVDRAAVQSIMEVTDCVVIDEQAMRSALPTLRSADSTEATQLIARAFDVQAVVWVAGSEGVESFEIRVGSEHRRGAAEYPLALHAMVTTSLVLRLLSGAALDSLIEQTGAIARHAAQHRDEVIPDELLA